MTPRRRRFHGVDVALFAASCASAGATAGAWAAGLGSPGGAALVIAGMLANAAGVLWRARPAAAREP